MLNIETKNVCYTRYKYSSIPYYITILPQFLEINFIPMFSY